jgi:hypothetical protein
VQDPRRLPSMSVVSASSGFAMACGGIVGAAAVVKRRAVSIAQAWSARENCACGECTEDEEIRPQMG